MAFFHVLALGVMSDTKKQRGQPGRVEVLRSADKNRKENKVGCEQSIGQEVSSHMYNRGLNKNLRGKHRGRGKMREAFSKCASKILSPKNQYSRVGKKFNEPKIDELHSQDQELSRSRRGRLAS